MNPRATKSVIATGSIAKGEFTIFFPVEFFFCIQQLIHILYSTLFDTPLVNLDHSIVSSEENTVTKPIKRRRLDNINNSDASDIELGQSDTDTDMFDEEGFTLNTTLGFTSIGKIALRSHPSFELNY